MINNSSGLEIFLSYTVQQVVADDKELTHGNDEAYAIHKA